MRFEHPITEKQVVITPASYLWAGIFGAAYVYWLGYGSIPRALLINLVLGLLVLAFIDLTFLLSAARQLLALVIFVPLIVWLQSRWMISIVRRGFRRAGWNAYR